MGKSPGGMKHHSFVGLPLILTLLTCEDHNKSLNHKKECFRCWLWLIIEKKNQIVFFFNFNFFLIYVTDETVTSR